MRFVPDVEYQFGSLRSQIPSVFTSTAHRDPTKCKHYQGVDLESRARTERPFLLLTRSGNIRRSPTSPTVWRATIPPEKLETGTGRLLTCAPREKHGERLRSNRLARETASMILCRLGGQGDHLNSPSWMAASSPQWRRRFAVCLPAIRAECRWLAACWRCRSRPRTQCESEPDSRHVPRRGNPEEPKFLSQFAPKNSAMARPWPKPGWSV